VLIAIWDWLHSVHWAALLSGAALATIGLVLRTVMREPLRAIAKDARFIRCFWWLSPQRPFKGAWIVKWNVDSSRFPHENVDTVVIRKLFSYVTFRTTTTLLDGNREDCVFIAKLHNRKLTGRWHNPVDEDNGYYGVFQMHIHAGRQFAEGAWAGFTNDGKVQPNAMSMQRVVSTVR
jgi:hypothetical protein